TRRAFRAPQLGGQTRQRVLSPCGVLDRGEAGSGTSLFLKQTRKAFSHRPRSHLQVVVKRWDQREEGFLPDSQMDGDEIERYAAGVRSFDFDKYLGPYPLEDRQKWAHLVHYVTPKVLDKLEPVTKVIRSQSSLEETKQLDRAMEEEV